MLREDDLLGPLERLGVLIVGSNEGVDLVANLPRRGEADAGQGFAGEDRKPDLDLVEPGGMGRDEMKMDVRVAREPAILLGPPQLGVIGRIGHQPAGLRKHSGQRMQPEGDGSELRARHEINARFGR